MNNFKVLMNGIVKENPTFVLLLGMCPTLGTTSSAINGMGMGLATMFVLICSNVVISSIKNLIPDMVRIPAFIVVILLVSEPRNHHMAHPHGRPRPAHSLHKVQCPLHGPSRHPLISLRDLVLHIIEEQICAAQDVLIRPQPRPGGVQAGVDDLPAVLP